MAKTATKQPSDYIVPLNINGLEGRMLSLPSSKAGKKREILLLYGSHSSIERMYTLAEELTTFGPVTLPDWPGFGGMDSLYKLGKKPSLDAMADYLAAFVKMRYRRKRYTIVGISYGFIVATRMLQRHPDLAKRVDLVISLAGFAHKDDFHVTRRGFLTMKWGTWTLKHKWTSRLSHLFIRPLTIRATYTLMAKRHNKMKGADALERKRRIDFEVILWRINDLRTYFHTANTMFTLDLGNTRVDVPCYHIAVSSDQFFDNTLVEQHLKVIYKKVTMVPITLEAHMPTIVASREEVAVFIPPKVRRMLARSA